MPDSLEKFVLKICGAPLSSGFFVPRLYPIQGARATACGVVVPQPARLWQADTFLWIVQTRAAIYCVVRETADWKKERRMCIRTRWGREGNERWKRERPKFRIIPRVGYGTQYLLSDPSFGFSGEVLGSPHLCIFSIPGGYITVSSRCAKYFNWKVYCYNDWKK